MRYVLPAAILAAHLAVGGPSVLRTLFDHLKCHTVRDPLRLEATADLPALQPDGVRGPGLQGGTREALLRADREGEHGTRTAGAGDHRSAAQEDYVCPRGGGRMRLIATIEDHRVIRKLLAHVGLPAGPTAPAAALRPSGTSQLPLCASPSGKPF